MVDFSADVVVLGIGVGGETVAESRAAAGLDVVKNRVAFWGDVEIVHDTDPTRDISGTGDAEVAR